MKALIVTMLILSVVSLAALDVPTRLESERMTSSQMAAIVGSGFWGGLVCGVAAGVTAVGVTAIVTAAGAGTTISLGVVFGYVAAAEVTAVCALL